MPRERLSADTNAAGQGLAVLQSLLEKPAVEVSDWVISQAEALNQPGVRIDSLPIFQLACALGDVPLQKKHIVVRSAIAGFADLPAPRRAEAVRLAIQAQEAAQHPATLESAESPPLMGNLIRLAQEAKLDRIPNDELMSIAQEAQTSAVSAIPPQQLVEVVSNLRPDEREKLTEALVESQIVKADERDTVEKAVKPGGYVDRLNAILGWFEWLHRRGPTLAYAWLGMAAVEFTLSMVLKSWEGAALMECLLTMERWLRADSCLIAAVVVFAMCISCTLERVYTGLREDPVGAAQRWQRAEGDLESQLESLVLDVPAWRYFLSAFLICLDAVLLLVGVACLVAALIQFSSEYRAGPSCSQYVLTGCLIYIGLRLAIVVGVVFAVLWLLFSGGRRPSTPVEQEVPLLNEAELTSASSHISSRTAVASRMLPDIAPTITSASAIDAALPGLQEEMRENYAQLMERLAKGPRGTGLASTSETHRHWAGQTGARTPPPRRPVTTEGQHRQVEIDRAAALAQLERMELPVSQREPG